MSVVSIAPLHRGRAGDGDDKYVRNYEQTWLVITDDPTDGPCVIGNAAGLPGRYFAYPDDPFALAIGSDVKSAGDETGLVWEVTLKYSTKYDVNQQQENPLDRVPRWSSGGQHFSKVAAKDNGLANSNKPKPILNLAGDAYDPPAEIDDSRMVLRVVRNEPVLPLQAQMTYANAVNSDQWNGAPVRTVKVESIESGELQNENGVQFYAVTYTFHYRPETWDLSILEQGYNGLSFKTGNPVKVPLGGDHPKLLQFQAPAGVTFTDDATQATFTKWRVYPEAAFANLNLTIPQGQ
jgi:hypothetical protein